MPPRTFNFEDFRLDPAQRQLRRDGALVELNTRYLDALVLLVREQGKLVSKDRFLDEVWRGVPVTEEALTQCIRTLRKQLGDSVANPRFIETVPKHGYRFIAPVALDEAVPGSAPAAAPSPAWREPLLLAAAGTTGAGVAGVLGGLFYGFVGASPGMGAISMVLVVVCLCIVMALIGGAGVSLGIAATSLLPGRRWRWSVVGGALGGLVVGGVVKLLGLDAFNLLLGRSPGDITGAMEGLLLGAAAGFGPWFGSRGGLSPWRGRSVAAATVAGAIAGLVIPLLGGRMMAGSLDLLARAFPDSRLRMDPIGHAFGEAGLGPVAQMATGVLEGALFGACLIAAMVAFAPLSRTAAPRPATAPRTPATAANPAGPSPPPVPPG
jgi:DNA-binding winged helix-turn-helix (wHTH) protein